MGRLVPFLVLLAAVLAFPAGLGKYDPESLRIRSFCIGESYYPETSYPLLLEGDPRISYIPIPANIAEGTFAQVAGGGGEEAARKFMRLYLPRTYDQLISSCDVAILSDFEAWLVPNQQFTWMRQAIEEEGMGLTKYEINWDTGSYYVRASEFIDLWIASPVFDAFPANFVVGRRVTYSNGIIPTEGNPVTDLPGIEKYDLLTSGSYGIETPRQGAEILAIFRNDPERNPAMISRMFGKGMSLSVLPGLDKIDAVALKEYPYYVDFWINQLYWSANFPIPEDVELVSVVRRDMVRYAEHKPLVMSVLDFVEKFGARVSVLEGDIGKADQTKAEADRLYMEQSYTESLEKLNEAYAILNEISDKAVELKDRALFWIYMTEWFTVTGVAMLAGFVLYTLMVKRRLYREVSVTRAG